MSPHRKNPTGYIFLCSSRKNPTEGGGIFVSPLEIKSGNFLRLPLKPKGCGYFYVCTCQNTKGNILLFPPHENSGGCIFLCFPLKTRQGENIFSCVHLKIQQGRNCFILNFFSVFQVCKEIYIRCVVFCSFSYNPDLCFFLVDFYQLSQKFVLKSLLNNTFECSFCLRLQHDFI